MMRNEHLAAVRRRALEQYFNRMNAMQREAVFQINGPVLILAGAGSGKTTVIVNRIANMIFFGDAYHTDAFAGELAPGDEAFLGDYAAGKETDSARLREICTYNCVKPWSILAITFTNKAAGELKERLSAMLGEDGRGITAATFHSACVRILRRECEAIGFARNFTIYDSDDAQRLVKSCLQELDISEKMFAPRMILTEISRQKDRLVKPAQFETSAAGDYKTLVIAKIYKLYQSKLRAANAMDFDDIICHTVTLFEDNPEILEHYQNLYKFILVDEYQDTNMVQYKLVSLLSGKHRNLCVVGDDDQSIYRFRGATIENILSFEKQFDTCTVIRLEQNYRSTQNILSGANELIKNNLGRKGKSLWTDSGDGEKITVYKAANERGEAKFVAESILDTIKTGGKYSDCAVLYRVNAQSNSLEQGMIAAGIPYKIFGGLKFYDRKEIKDVLAYLHVINNNADMLRLRRIINEPKRGIGDATVAVLEQIVSDIRETPVAVMRSAAELGPLAKKAKPLTELAAVFDELTALSEEAPLDELLDTMLIKTGYAKSLREQGEEGLARLDNINELKSTMIEYGANAEEPSLAGFLEEIALYTDIDGLDDSADYVVMMTIHAAKGLEFPNVFVVGMEENVFPSARSLESEADVEEERRLAYVAVTRAKRRLFLVHCAERMLYGMTNRNRVSRFVKEIPQTLLTRSEELGLTEKITAGVAGVSPASLSLQEQLANKRRTDAPKETHRDFKVGDSVSHNIFGAGTVVSAVVMSSDTMLEVAFEKVGTKKIMANFAKIKKI
ncbi:MAG: 3'-5' exonuclease [Oscillospiraceae bacterium]